MSFLGRGKEIWIAASALSVVLAAQAQAAEQQRSGVAGFARGANSARGASAPQPLVVGDPVFFDQTINTDANGRALIIMADRSTLAVGPNSNIVIEKYAYDKASGTGEMVMNAARGLFRFVGGALSKKRPVEMRIATGTIGVRGGVIFVDIPGAGNKGLSGGDAGGGDGNGGGGGRVGLLYGDSLTFTNNSGQSTEVNRPGTIIEFTDSGETSVYEADANMLAEISTQLENPNKQEGGSSGSSDGAGTNVDPTITDTTITDSNEVAEVLDRELNTALDTFQQTQQTLIDTAQEMMDDDLDEPDPDPMMPGGSGGLSPGV